MDSRQPLCGTTDRMLTIRNWTPLKRQRFYVWVCANVCVQWRQRERKMLRYADICMIVKFYSNMGVFIIKHEQSSHESCTKWWCTVTLCNFKKILENDGTKLQTACPYSPTQLVCDTLRKTIEKREAADLTVQFSVDGALSHWDNLCPNAALCKLTVCAVLVLSLSASQIFLNFPLNSLMAADSLSQWI